MCSKQVVAVVSSVAVVAVVDVADENLCFAGIDHAVGIATAAEVVAEVVVAEVVAVVVAIDVAAPANLAVVVETETVEPGVKE